MGRHKMKLAIAFFLLGLVYTSSGLDCQVCDGNGGECSSPSDNGKNVTCTEDQDACWYQSLRNGDDETVSRNCINSAGVGDHCVDVDVAGFGGTECFALRIIATKTTNAI